MRQATRARRREFDVQQVNGDDEKDDGALVKLVDEEPRSSREVSSDESDREEEPLANNPLIPVLRDDSDDTDSSDEEVSNILVL